MNLNFVERQAYREAGHATIAYLIRKGFIDKYVPIDRSLILPEFEKVAIEGKSADWGRTTFSLGSLVTVSQVLLAGYAAEQLRYNIVEKGFPDDEDVIRRARHLLAAYIEEYYSLSFADRDRQAAEWLNEIYGYVKENLRTHWAAVETLAGALLEYKSLPKE